MADRYWTTAGGTWNASPGTKWSTTSGGAGGAAPPTASDDVYFDNATNCTLGGTTLACRSINFTGYTGTFNHVNTAILNVGTSTANGATIALKCSTGMTYTASGVLNFISTSTTQQTITCAGKTLPITSFSGVGSSYVLTDAFGSTGTLTINNGTFDTGNFDVAAKGFASSNGNARTITLGTSTMTLITGGFSNGWNVSTTTGLTNPSSAFASTTITFGTNAAPVSFAGGGLTYGTVSVMFLWFGLSLGLTITGSNTFTNLSVSTSAGGNISTLVNSGTQTITNSLTLQGGSGDLLQISGGAFSKTVTNVVGGRTFTANYVTLTNSTALGEAKFFATNSTDVSGNTNWRFNAPNQGTQTTLGCGI